MRDDALSRADNNIGFAARRFPRRAVWAFVVLLAAPGLSACGAEREIYDARGTVLWHEPGRIYINHAEIPGFMDAMAMGFDVRDPALLEGLEPGTSVRFRVVVEGDSFHIDRLRQTN